MGGIAFFESLVSSNSGRLTAPGRFPFTGAVAQLEEHLLCKQEVVGSNPIGSIKSVNDL